MRVKIRYIESVGLFKEKESEAFLLGFSDSYFGYEKAHLMDKDGRIFDIKTSKIIKGKFVKEVKR